MTLLARMFHSRAPRTSCVAGRAASGALHLLFAALLICGAWSVAEAADNSGKGDALLSWQPVRPAQRVARNADSDSPLQLQPAAGKQRSARVAPQTRIDPQVTRVVLQQSDDPLANPFNDPLPKSPFRSSGLQTVPADSNSGPEEIELGFENTAARAQPNPFETQPSQPDAPGQLPQDDSIAPPDGDSGLDFEIEPLDPNSGSGLPDPKKDCEAVLAYLRQNRLNLARSRSIVDLKPQAAGELPYHCTVREAPVALDSGRNWPQTCYTWKASGLCHKPLYFEQSHMERYGHSWGPVLDPVVSGAHFFASVPMLPYKMGLEPPHECIYPLGHYRPGSCAPRYIEPFPFSIRAAALEAGAITGLSFAVP